MCGNRLKRKLWVRVGIPTEQALIQGLFALFVFELSLCQCCREQCGVSTDPLQYFAYKQIRFDLQTIPSRPPELWGSHLHLLIRRLRWAEMLWILKGLPQLGDSLHKWVNMGLALKLQPQVINLVSSVVMHGLEEFLVLSVSFLTCLMNRKWGQSLPELIWAST